MEKIYYVEVSGNEVKSFINLKHEKIVSKKVDSIEIKGIFLEWKPNSSFELDGIGEVRLIKQDLKDSCYDFAKLKRFLLDINIDEDIEDDLFE